MSAEETLPMLDGVKTTKKQSYGLAAFMVLCLAVTSFMAGHAYSSAATASAVQWSQGESCSRWKSDMISYYCADQGDCLVGVIYQGASGTVEECVAASTGPSCDWAYDITYNQQGC